MLESECFTYRETNCFSELICEYLEQNAQLTPFYGRFPTLESFKDQMEAKGGFSSEVRQTLVKRLSAQYAAINSSTEAGRAVNNNIEKLGDSNTFTIVTGHQLNILTGPLYFIYKIVSTINLSRQLADAYPEKSFVPVYWMATEDHDFEEINYINQFGGRLKWDRKFGGPVGRFSTDGLEAVISELEEHLGPGTNNQELIEIFKKAYLTHDTLAEATRYLVHELFGAYGLVCLDGDDQELKTLMIPFFEKELLEEASLAPVQELTEKLEELHFKQVQPRAINLFYILDGVRERIESRNGRWEVLNTEISFDEEDLKQELHLHPERFSPNVVLRPLYQEVILPNLAYIGGGGELAYWFQLKKLFTKADVPFPMLVLRNSVLWIKRKYAGKLKKLELSVGDLFQPLHEVQKQYVSERAPVDPALTPYEKKIEQIFNELEEVAKLTDDSMLGAVNAQRAKQLNGLDNLRKKLIRAEKRRKGDEMEQIESLYLALFPAHGLQERHDNLSIFFSEYGRTFIEQLLDQLNPLDFKFTVLREE